MDERHTNPFPVLETQDADYYQYFFYRQYTYFLERDA